MLLLIAKFFSEEFIFANKYVSLSNITLLDLLGFTRHYIDFGFCNSTIFILFCCFKSKQNRYKKNICSVLCKYSDSNQTQTIIYNTNRPNKNQTLNAMKHIKT